MKLPTVKEFLTIWGNNSNLKEAGLTTIPHVLNEGKTVYHMALHGLLGLFGETAQGSTKLKKCALFEHQCI